MNDPLSNPVRVAADPDAGAAALTRALVSTPSVNPTLESSGTGEAEIAALVADWLEAWGFATDVTEVRPGRPNVVGRLRRGGDRRLILNGHLDTVGVEGMSVAPFSAEVRNGRLWGRGACDMKAGVAALLAAARDAARAGRFRGELIVALVADEERASIGMQALMARGETADAAVVCEPTGLAVMPAHKGFVWTEARFRGRAAHGSRPDRGVDAIRHAGRFLTRLDDLEAALRAGEPHPLLGYGSIHAGTIEGGDAPSVYPASCRLVLERRTLPGERPAGVVAELEALLDGLRGETPQLDVELEPGLARPGTEVPTDSAVVRTLQAALAEHGIEPEVRGMTAWVDAALLNEAGIPAVCFGPGHIEDAHSADESVEIDQIDAAHAVLSDFIHRILA